MPATERGATRLSNKEMKLTKPGQNGASQLISSVRLTYWRATMTTNCRSVRVASFVAGAFLLSAAGHSADTGADCRDGGRTQLEMNTCAGQKAEAANKRSPPFLPSLIPCSRPPSAMASRQFRRGGSSSEISTASGSRAGSRADQLLQWSTPPAWRVRPSSAFSVSACSCARAVA